MRKHPIKIVLLVITLVALIAFARTGRFDGLAEWFGAPSAPEAIEEEEG